MLCGCFLRDVLKGSGGVGCKWMWSIELQGGGGRGHLLVVTCFFFLSLFVIGTTRDMKYVEREHEKRGPPAPFDTQPARKSIVKQGYNRNYQNDDHRLTVNLLCFCSKCKQFPVVLPTFLLSVFRTPPQFEFAAVRPCVQQITVRNKRTRTDINSNMDAIQITRSDRSHVVHIAQRENNRNDGHGRLFKSPVTLEARSGGREEGGRVGGAKHPNVRP